ncbi:acyltransferase [Paenibacillus lactis]|uniref:acyltransferase family protein n=1 Tax=Paenibacillus lactis TaxID=228574 RepID=UPI00203B371A|nr:acyltransferase [Paenibacillus lactis]MCM3492835.1 acyltransferase [Paenibacillus lactis]
MQKERVFGLDFIRAISVIIIVFYHFSTTLIGYKITSPLSKTWSYANGDISTIGISLFFIISGAALMTTYNKKYSMKKYLSKRFLSIYPMFWMAYIIAFLILFYINKTIAHLPNINFLWTVIGMDGYMLYRIPTYYILGEWFLGCIILLYLLFPILMFFMNKQPTILFIAAGVLFIFFVETYGFKMPIIRNFIARIPEFLMGMYFIKYIKSVKFYQFLIASVVIMLLIFVRIDIPGMYKVTIIGISAFFVLFYLAQHISNSKFRSVLNEISKYSYAVFLTHHVIMMEIIRKFNGMALTAIEALNLFIISCVVISIVSVYLLKISNHVTGRVRLLKS